VRHPDANYNANGSSSSITTDTGIEIVVFTKARGPLTKSISLVDGKVKSDSSECRMTHGSAERRRLTGLADLAALIDDLKPIQAIGLGALRADLADKVAISTKDRLASNPNTDGIARTAENIAYRPGQPGLVLLDFDAKGMPDAIAKKITDLGY
jgi:hypothetical protein